MITQERIHPVPPDTCFGLLRDHVLPGTSLPTSVGAAGRPLVTAGAIRFDVLKADRRAKRVETQPLYDARGAPNRKLGQRTFVYAEFVDRATSKVVFETEGTKGFVEMRMFPKWAKWPSRLLAEGVGFGTYLGDELITSGDMLARDDYPDQLVRAFLTRLYAAADARLAEEVAKRFPARAPA
ncbi:MAG TPA: hypothetical protein VGW75_14965 [Solirubrobacteraceae bacterium]|nr:hypothetical protein [Solirubrobacteraceae bacterium]